MLWVGPLQTYLTVSYSISILQMTISHGFIYIPQAEFKRQLLNSTSKSRRTTHSCSPKRKQICRIFLWLAIWLQNFCSILNSPVPHEILRAHRTFVQRKVWKCFPSVTGSFRECASEALTWHLPNTEVHSQLGTNSGASALKDAAETPPLGPFAWDKMFLAEDTSKASRFQAR